MYKVLNWRQRKRWGFFIEASTEERDLCCAKKDDYDETRRVLTSPDESRRDSTTRMGFEPTHAEHIGLAVQRLNHSATSSHNISHSKLRRLMWQTFCIPLGLECCRYVFMCNDRNVLLCWQIGQLLQSLWMRFRLLHRRIGRPHFGKRKDPEDEVGESEGIDWSDCVSTAVKHIGIFFFIWRDFI